uniref:ATP synthase F0 subunit 8 n=1 Tax=Periphyllus acerihabitans TaxID=1785073 RepID=A0A1L5YAF7_9HEMI|nr:ATP synthase F0 subunit 8 [Periphyllus acerihabitans]
MSPINWILLFMYFFIMMYILMNMLYFNFMKNFKLKKLHQMKTKNYNKFI